MNKCFNCGKEISELSSSSTCETCSRIWSQAYRAGMDFYRDYGEGWQPNPTERYINPPLRKVLFKFSYWLDDVTHKLGRSLVIRGLHWFAHVLAYNARPFT